MSAVKVGNYRLLAQLGSGGMADVFLAVDERMSVTKLVVVKRVRSHLADDAELCALLLEEARVSARLNHPNVVQVLDAGMDGSECYLAMEYLDGQPLSIFMKHAASDLPKDAWLVVLADVLRGLHYAHELADYDGMPLRLVHRDVSPQNVFVTYDGQVKLLDFGIAKAAGRATETREGFFRGKIRYMPPEQALGLPVDARADVFSAGILVWQAVTGRRFWGEASDAEVMYRLQASNYDASLRPFVPDVAPALETVVQRALAPTPDRRYASAGAMLADLEDHLGHRIVDLRKQLVATLRDRFVDDRARRRAIIEELGASSSIASSLGAIVLRSTTRMAAVAVDAPLVASGGVSSFEAPDGTQSLAKILEPSLARGTVPRRRSAWPLVVAAGLVVGAASVGGLGLAQRRAASPSRAAASVASDVSPVSFASDGRAKLAANEPPARDGAADDVGPLTATTKKTGEKAPVAPASKRRTWEPKLQGGHAAHGSASASAPPRSSSGLDRSDPWR